MKRFKRILKTSWSYVNRNSGLAFSTIVVVFITFFITTIFLLMFIGSQFLFSGLEQQLGLTLFFKPETEESQILELSDSLESGNGRLRIEYKSKDDVYEEYVEIFGDRAGEFVTDDLLTPALRINSTDVNDVQVVYEQVTGNQEIMDSVHSYIYFDQAVGVLKKATVGIFWGGAVLSTILLLSSFIIIMITTDISIANSGEEIKTMQLIGADKGYIRWPFVISGGFCSLIGAFVSVLVFTIAGFFIYRSLVDQGVDSFIVEKLLPGVQWPKFEAWYLIVAGFGEILLGWFIGSVSSYVAVKRRLRL